MVARWIEALTGSWEQKRQYKLDKARIEGLPEPYGTVAMAIHRYLNYYGGITDGASLITMLGDLADLFERAAIDQTPVRDIVGGDPVEFSEVFAQAYTSKRWIDKERARLVRVVEDAERREQK